MHQWRIPLIPSIRCHPTEDPLEGPHGRGELPFHIESTHSKAKHHRLFNSWKGFLVQIHLFPNFDDPNDLSGHAGHGPRSLPPGNDEDLREIAGEIPWKFAVEDLGVSSTYMVFEHRTCWRWLCLETMVLVYCIHSSTSTLVMEWIS